MFKEKDQIVLYYFKQVGGVLFLEHYRSRENACQCSPVDIRLTSEV